MSAGAREAAIDKESGFIVPPCDPPAMALRIVELLNRPDLARAMGERGRERVEQVFSCRAQLERTENLYDELLTPAGIRQPLIQKDSPQRHRGHGMADEAPSARGGEAEKSSAPLRVLIVAPSLDILGGQAVQASRLLARLREEAAGRSLFLARQPAAARRVKAITIIQVCSHRCYVFALLGAAVSARARVRCHTCLFRLIHFFRSRADAGDNCREALS